MSLNLNSHRTTGKSEAENPYTLSFSDVLASLLLIFILALVVVMKEFIEVKNELQEREKLMTMNIEELQRKVKLAEGGEKFREKLLKTLEFKLKEAGLKVIVDEANSVIRIPEDLLNFKSGHYTIPPEYVENVDKIGRTLLEVLNSLKEERRKYLDTIFIEGHTDSSQYKNYNQGNWGLSTQRAVEVWLHWTKSPGSAAELKELKTIKRALFLDEQDVTDCVVGNKNDCKSLFSVSGYGPSRRIDLDETTLEESAKNRRIDIRFTLRTISSKEYQAIEESVEKGLKYKLKSAQLEGVKDE